MKELIQPVIDRALIDVASVPPRERADLFDGVAVLLKPHDPDAAADAALTASALREAESQQAHFLEKFTSLTK